MSPYLLGVGVIIAAMLLAGAPVWVGCVIAAFAVLAEKGDAR